MRWDQEDLFLAPKSRKHPAFPPTVTRNEPRDITTPQQSPWMKEMTHTHETKELEKASWRCGCVAGSSKRSPPYQRAEYDKGQQSQQPRTSPLVDSLHCSPITLWASEMGGWYRKHQPTARGLQRLCRSTLGCQSRSNTSPRKEHQQAEVF